MSRRLRAGMSGCGGICTLSLEAARESPDFEIVALHDLDPARLEAIGAQYGIETQHVRFEDLLASDLDFVILNTPNHVHAEQVGAAAQAGIPCLVQKPMARHEAEADEMLAICREHEVRLGVLMAEIGDPRHHCLKRLVERGWFGGPGVVHACRAHAHYLRQPPPQADWRRDPESVGGSAFLQLASHSLNLICWLLETEIMEVQALGSAGTTVFEQDALVANLAARNGWLVQLAASYTTDWDSLSLSGPRGQLQVTAGHWILRGEQAFADEILRYDTPGVERVFEIPPPPGGFHAMEIHSRFARWIRDDEAFPCSGEIGRRDLRVLDAIRASGGDGRRRKIADCT